MYREVKYSSEVGENCSARCSEQLPGCETTVSYHVCFDDGSGEFVCRKCFDQRVNEGEWVTDATELVLAS